MGDGEWGLGLGIGIGTLDQKLGSGIWIGDQELGFGIEECGLGYEIYNWVWVWDLD